MASESNNGQNVCMSDLNEKNELDSDAIRSNENGAISVEDGAIGGEDNAIGRKDGANIDEDGVIVNEGDAIVDQGDAIVHEAGGVNKKNELGVDAVQSDENDKDDGVDKGGVIGGEGNVIGAEGDVIDAEGNVIDAEGNVISDEGGVIVDEGGAIGQEAGVSGVVSFDHILVIDDDIKWNNCVEVLKDDAMKTELVISDKIICKDSNSENFDFRKTLTVQYAKKKWNVLSIN